MIDTVRINEIHLWLNKVRTDINLNFNLVISHHKQISFTFPQTRNDNSVIHQGK